MNNQIYISYTQSDEAIARRISEILKEIGLSIFVDTESLSFGMDFASTIVNEIKGCRLVIAIISERYINSQWALKEIEIATQSQKRIIPIIVGNILLTDIPDILSNVQCLLLKDVLANPRLLILSIQGNLSEGKERQRPSLTDFIDADGTITRRTARPKTYSRRSGRKVGCLIISALAVIVLAMFFISFPVGQTKSDSSRIESSIENYQDSINDGSAFPVDSSFHGKNDNHQQDSEFEKPCSSNHNSLKEITIIVLLLLFICSLVWIVLLYRRYKMKKISLTLSSDAKVIATIDETPSIVESGQEQVLSLNQKTHKLALDYSKYNSWKKINCFIAGSTSLQSERDALRSSISIACNRWSKKNFQILSFTYEDFDRKFTKDGQQSLYDYFISHDADYAIFIIKGDVGDFTIREFDKAYAAFKTHGKPSIVVYNSLSDENFSSAEALRERVRAIHQYWVDYKDQEVMRHHFLDLISTELFTLFEAELIQR